ncbi:Na+ transporter [Leptospira biflexa serovar Patoc strain 'Patoc 1 (Ames)']|uniref:Putative transporter, sodium/bile acid cotransporter family protein n=1 Tax=Leptospira biflexa serovar Patoc (strain Patoc 1 / ATCC 23582 / Paris) TaxID=456481 RepID=B0SJU4_LEPBP|nr:bile acid:sodium symporter family protein [Leptospira biflexa]ABZ92660.1 Na+ transporter [Leptospira biflexa serovar Patoc strain 'Patoc 1 (Ames)']ABZ96261.1 Putative transporter, sodium/bile acid cotransporter family protein [Leptospira biflexa serovar Patoc strain 'Patoc 1 (Paris)']
MNYNNDYQIVLGLVLALMIFGVALELRFIAFKAVLQRPVAAMSGLIGQVIILPWMTLLITLMLDLPAGIELGMLLVAASPGGNLSNIITHLGKGNTALSVSMTAVSSLFAIITLPLNFTLTANLNPVTHAMISGSGELRIDSLMIIKSMIVLLLVPLLLGMILGNFFTKFAHKITPFFKRISSFAFLVFLIVAVGGNWKIFLENLGFVFIIVVFHNLIALIIGNLIARLFRQNESNKRAITIEVGMQNSGLALGLILTQFQAEPNMALVAAFWGIWHIISGLILVMYWKNHPPVEGN